MPSKSKSQQRLFGMIHSYQKGQMKHAPSKIKNVAKHISITDALHFAETKTKGLPEHVKKATHTDEVADKSLIKKMVKPEAIKDMNKEAFERGFIKAALENKVNPLLAVKLLKQANMSMPNGVDDLMQHHPQEVINMGTDAGLGGLAGTAAGGLAGYLGGRNKHHPENDHSMRDMVLMSMLGGGIGTMAGGAYGGNKLLNAAVPHQQ